MRSITKWRQLPAGRRAMLPQALAAVVLVRLCLRFLPPRAWDRLTGRVAVPRGPARDASTMVQDVAWAVRTVSRAVPGATCLTQSLAAQLVLSRHGHVARLRIGVAREPGEKLRAHAWLESDGIIVLGGSSVEAYTALRPVLPSVVHLESREPRRGPPGIRARTRYLTMEEV